MLLSCRRLYCLCIRICCLIVYFRVCDTDRQCCLWIAWVFSNALLTTTKNLSVTSTLERTILVFLLVELYSLHFGRPSFFSPDIHHAFVPKWYIILLNHDRATQSFISKHDIGSSCVSSVSLHIYMNLQQIITGLSQQLISVLQSRSSRFHMSYWLDSDRSVGRYKWSIQSISQHQTDSRPTLCLQ